MNIQISYGKKIPGAQDYSSESYHVTISQDLATDCDDGVLRQAMQALYELARQEVNERLGQAPVRAELQVPAFAPANGHVTRTRGARMQPSRTASSKQVTYLVGLANQSGLSFEGLERPLLTRTSRSLAEAST